jgi:hypothetical protein
MAFAQSSTHATLVARFLGRDDWHGLERLQHVGGGNRSDWDFRETRPYERALIAVGFRARDTALPVLHTRTMNNEFFNRVAEQQRHFSRVIAHRPGRAIVQLRDRTIECLRHRAMVQLPDRIAGRL